MRSYTQLTKEERYHIDLMKQQGHSLRAMAKGMSRSHTTLGRDVKRNRGKRGYRDQQAHEKTCERHTLKDKATKLTAEVKAYITAGLQPLWSPEQICGRLNLERKIQLSHMEARIIGVKSLIEWIYRSDLRRLMSAPVWVIGRRI